MFLQRFPDVCGQFGNVGRSVIGLAEARARRIARDGRGRGKLFRGAGCAFDGDAARSGCVGLFLGKDGSEQEERQE